MTEIITSSVSSRRVLEAKGCEVITRCKDCVYSKFKCNSSYCRVWERDDIDPDGHCYKGSPREGGQ